MRWRPKAGDPVRHLFIVAREQQPLYEHLTRQFWGDEGIDVILNQRIGERRQVTTPYEPERRQRDRRLRTETEVELKRRGCAIVSLV